MNKHQCFGLVCGSFLAVAAAHGQTMIEGFEYATTDDLAAAWLPSANAIVSVSDSVAPRSTGKTSMKVEFNFPSMAWATEVVNGIDLAEPLSIDPAQYVTFRLRGDPAFAPSDFRNLYLYAYDADGNFARWPGTTVPLNDDWQIINYKADSLQLPWNSTTLPDLSRLTKFAFYQYGSETAKDAYSATIYIDDLMVRDTPLTEFPMPAARRELLDDFESYTDDAALRAFYAYENSPAGVTATVASIESPAPQGSKALKLVMDFAAGQWPWGSVWSKSVPAFSMPTNAVVSLRFKGDPNLASIADDGTVVRLSFADKAGSRINAFVGSATVLSPDWMTVEVPVAYFDNLTTVDIGNIVQWQLLVEGWQGTAESTALSGTFFFDDVRITIPAASEQPTLGVTRDAGVLKLNMSQLTVGKQYEVRTSTDLSQWNVATTITAMATTDSWPISPSDLAHAFYRLAEKTQ
jgi:hypothetical protein